MKKKAEGRVSERERMDKKAEGLVSGKKDWERRPRAGSPKGKEWIRRPRAWFPERKIGIDGRGPGLRMERMDKKAEGLFSEVIERRDTAGGRESE